MSPQFGKGEFAAFLALLREDREAREALAKLVRDETIERLTAEVRALAEAQRRTEARMAEFAVLIGALHGESLERRYQEKAQSYFSRIARRVRVLPLEQLDRILDQAVANQAISDEEAEDVRQADMVLVGRTVREGAPVYLVVEASATVDGDDVDRAARQAAILARAGLPAFPVTAGARITVDGEEAARARDVWRVLDGRTYPPGAPVGAGAA
ncbi:MAG TPA: hypothetical protein VNO34_05430 [Actinomycetota bacterium]|nr:hypothetical protein [Actinomycetota bacterium]